VHHAPWHAQKPAATAPAKPAAANAGLGPSRIAPAATPGTHGASAKAANAKLKKFDQLKTHGRGNAAHGNVAHQPKRVHPARGASAHKNAKPEPRRLQLPGPIVEHPRRGRGKHK
jgi:hypothetical protein